jgi:hypothetical protein
LENAVLLAVEEDPCPDMLQHITVQGTWDFEFLPSKLANGEEFVKVLSKGPLAFTAAVVTDQLHKTSQDPR